MVLNFAFILHLNAIPMRKDPFALLPSSAPKRTSQYGIVGILDGLELGLCHWLEARRTLVRVVDEAQPPECLLHLHGAWRMAHAGVSGERTQPYPMSSAADTGR